MLETERVVLLPWKESDRAELARVTSNPDVVRYVGAGEPWSDDKVGEWIARQQGYFRDLGHCLWAVRERADGPVIGYSGTQPLGDTGEVEIGWVLDPSAWGRGLATEAGRLAYRHAVETIGLRRIVAIAYPENRASIRVMEKLGMRYEQHMNWKGLEVVRYARGESTSCAVSGDGEHAT